MRFLSQSCLALRLGLSALIVSVLVAACQPGTAIPPASEDRLKVVATFSILADWVANVGRDRIELHTIVGPGVDTHTFEPLPMDSAALAEADLVFALGLGFEPWLDDLFEASGAQAVLIAVGETISALPSAGDSSDEFGVLDPHVWQDPSLVVPMVERIAQELARADPSHTDLYAANAAAYQDALRELDGWIAQETRSLQPERRILLTHHDTMRYFARRYGFEIVGSVMATSTEGSSPAPRELVRLADAARAAGLPALFSEVGASDRLLRQVAEAAGIEVIVPLYVDSLGPPGSGADTYLGMMRHNVEAIVGALGDGQDR